MHRRGVHVRGRLRERGLTGRQPAKDAHAADLRTAARPGRRCRGALGTASAGAERGARRRGGGLRRDRGLRGLADAGRAAGLARDRRRLVDRARADRHRIAAERCPGPLRLSPAARGRRCARGAHRPDPARREVDRRPVLPDRQRPHRAPVPGRAVGGGGTRRARARPRRRPVRPARGRAVRRPGRPARLRRPPVQPAAGARRQLRVARRLLGARVRAHQPPHAQQAADRRQHLRDHRRPQHRRRVLRPQRQRPLHRHGPVVVGRRRADVVGAVRRVLELALRLPGREPAARAPARRRRARRVADPGACRLPTAPTTRRRSSPVRSPTSWPPAGSRCASPPRASSPTGPTRSPTTTATAPTARSCAPTSTCSRRRKPA